MEASMRADRSKEIEAQVENIVSLMANRQVDNYWTGSLSKELKARGISGGSIYDYLRDTLGMKQTGVGAKARWYIPPEIIERYAHKHVDVSPIPASGADKEPPDKIPVAKTQTTLPFTSMKPKETYLTFYRDKFTLACKQCGCRLFTLEYHPPEGVRAVCSECSSNG
jgi:hypothetical protein